LIASFREEEMVRIIAMAMLVSLFGIGSAVAQLLRDQGSQQGWQATFRCCADQLHQEVL
jgi:hypothetical protein